MMGGWNVYPYGQFHTEYSPTTSRSPVAESVTAPKPMTIEQRLVQDAKDFKREAGYAYVAETGDGRAAVFCSANREPVQYVMDPSHSAKLLAGWQEHFEALEKKAKEGR